MKRSLEGFPRAYEVDEHLGGIGSGIGVSVMTKKRSIDGWRWRQAPRFVHDYDDRFVILAVLEYWRLIRTAGFTERGI